MGKKQRQDDYLAVFSEIIDHSIDIDADAILHTGNLFWSQSPDNDVLNRCREIISRCDQAGVDFHLLQGDRDQKYTGVLSNFEDDGLLTVMDPRWNRIGDVAVFVNDSTVSDPESAFHYPPEDATIRAAALADDLASTTGFERVNEYESAVGWALDAIWLGNQSRPVARVENNVQVLSPGPPERVVGKAFIDDDPVWKPQIFIYDCTAGGISKSVYETDARSVSGFNLTLEASDTVEDVRELLSERSITDSAAIFEIEGVKTEKSPTKSEIEAIVDEDAAFTRGYDNRSKVENKETESAKRKDLTGESEGDDDAIERNGHRVETDTDMKRASTRLVAFGHVGDDGGIIDRIGEETAGDRVDAYIYTGTNRSAAQETDNQHLSSEIKAALDRLAEQAPVYVVPADGVSVWQADTDQYAPHEPPAPSLDDEAWPTGVTPIPFNGRVAVDDWFLTRNPLLGSDETLLVTHQARPEQWHGGHAGYIAGGHFIGRHDRTYLNVGFASFDPGVGRDALYGQVFEFTLDDGLEDLNWTAFGTVQRQVCPDHHEYGELFLLEELDCPFCTMEIRPESSGDTAIETPSTVYERAYLVASDDLPARQAHQVAYFSRYDVPPPSKTENHSFPPTTDDGQGQLDDMALERGDLRGELMYFLDPAAADDVWVDIRNLVAQGELYDARISTAFTRTARGDSQHLLLITVPNYTDMQDAHRVHKRLTDALNLDDPVSLKPTIYTELGIYTANAADWDLSRSTRYTIKASEKHNKRQEISNRPAIDADSLPTDLIDIDQWLLWKPEPDGRKIPRAPWETGDDTFVSAMEEVNQTSFDVASEYLEKLPGDYGLAFTITEDDPFVLLDYDDARDPDTGEIPALVRQHITDADSYADVSTSGSGVHILARGALGDEITAVVADLPDHDFSIEVYDSDRFIAMTGEQIAGTPTETTPAQGLLDRLQSEHATRRDYENRRTNEERIKSRSELADIETTNDIEDIFASIKQTRPSDIRLRSTVTKERADGSKSLDPSWTTSESGTRLGELDDIWIYRKGMYALDAIQVVALEERLITRPDEYPSGETFWETVEALRERGAHIPRYKSEGK